MSYANTLRAELAEMRERALEAEESLTEARVENHHLRERIIELNALLQVAADGIGEAEALLRPEYIEDQAVG